MPAGEIIAIGTELLLGEVQDTNTAHIARTFRDAGIDLYRTTIVGDNVERISQAIREALSRAEIVITTGGLGPTIDDPTRVAVAKAFDTEPEFRPELWEQIQARFQRFHRQATENNRRQAYIPIGAASIENQVGTAPAFYMDKDRRVVISLPGVPREMEHILEQKVMPMLRERFGLNETIKAYILHAAGVGESQVDEWIGELEMQSNPTVGLSCKPGQIDIRVTAKAGSAVGADELIAETVAKIRQRVGVAIYGSNEDTLEKVVLERLKMHGWNLSLVECGLNGAANARLESFLAEGQAHVLSQVCTPEELQQILQKFRREDQAQVSIGIGYYPGPVEQDVYLYLITPNAAVEANRSYGGPPASGSAWAVKTALDFVRRNIP